MANPGSTRRQCAGVRDPPRLRAVGHRAVGQHQHRRPVRHRDPHGLQRDVEAVTGRARREDRQRCLAVAAEHRLQQVGLLGLGGQPRRRAAALHVDHQERELEGDGEPDRLALQRDPGAGGGGDAQRAAERRAQRRTDAGDLVFGLEGRDAERLVLAQLVQDVAGRRDRVRAEEHRQPGDLPRGHDPVGDRGVAGDLAVVARGQRRRRDVVGHGERLGGLAVRVARTEREHVRLGEVGSLRELLPQEPFGALGGPVVHPRQQTQGEHVLRALGVLLAQPGLLQRAAGQRRHRDLVHRVALQRAVVERRDRVADLGQVPLGELVGVHDQDAAGGQVGDVRLQRGGVHRHQHVRPVAGGEDVVVREVQLERRHARQRPGGCPDLGGEVRAASTGRCRTTRSRR